MIVADTGAIVALIDADDQHHREMVEQFEDDPAAWVLPWAILPEIDYLLLKHVGPRAERAFVRDLADGAYSVEWGVDDDLVRAGELTARYAALSIGLSDAVVIAVAERLRASAIATFDLRHFAAIDIRGTPTLLPRGRPTRITAETPAKRRGYRKSN